MKNLLLEIIQTLEPNLKDIVTIAEDVPRLYAQKNLGPLLPIAIMGNGIVRLSNILCSILEFQKGIVLIDEIENGFHYSFYPLLWKAIKKLSSEFDIQIFITTHSLECIEAASNENFNNSTLSYIRLGLDQDNNVIPFKFTADELEYAIKHDIEVR